MAALPDLSAMTLNTHTQLREDAQVGIYFPQTIRRFITPSRGSIAPDVDRDGQCLFHCLSKLNNRTFGTYRTTEHVIGDIKSHLDKNWDRMASEHREKSAKEEYLKKVGHRWGGPLEIDAACELYNVNIFEWRSLDAHKEFADEKALRSAVLSAKYHPKLGTNEELQALPAWDLFLHRNHFRYLEKTTSMRIHDAAAQAAFQRSPRKAAPRTAPMNKTLREMAEARESRARGAPAGGVCHTEPLPDPDESATEQLIRKLLAQEEQEERDAELARQQQQEESDAELARQLEVL